MNKSDFYSQADTFLHHLFGQMKKHQVQLKPHWSMDHLCFRVQSLEAYEQYKINFLSFGQMLIESEVNGRMIATYKLAEPVVFQNYRIDLVELPAPKPGKKTIEGFEHVEVVSDEPFEKLVAQYSGLRLDVGGLRKSFNQELEIEMEGCALKFHPLSLESVIRLEKNQKVHRALMSSKVLEILKAFHPLVAGTFPLGLDIAGSDVDILLTTVDLQVLRQTLEETFGSLKDFGCFETEKTGTATLVARFTYHGIPFELFAQKSDSIQQDAYRHFQAEEKLLKLGGESFRQKILQLRNAGLKTEPAFAKALNLSGDPCVELLQMQKMSEQELALRFT